MKKCTLKVYTDQKQQVSITIKNKFMYRNNANK